MTADQVFNSLRLQRMKLFNKLKYLSADEHCARIRSECCACEVEEEDVVLIDECLLRAGDDISDHENAALYFICGYIKKRRTLY